MDLIRRIAMADPKVVGSFASPGGRCLGAKDLDEQAVLASSGNLAHRQRPSRAVAHGKHHRAEIFRMDRDLVVFIRLKCFTGESLDGVFRFLARFVKGVQIGTQGGDALAGDVLGQVAPVGSDVGKGARRAVDSMRQFQSVS